MWALMPLYTEARPSLLRQLSWWKPSGARWTVDCSLTYQLDVLFSALVPLLQVQRHVPRPNRHLVVTMEAADHVRHV
jgi:hypothetical protein